MADVLKLRRERKKATAKRQMMLFEPRPDERPDPTPDKRYEEPTLFANDPAGSPPA